MTAAFRAKRRTSLLQVLKSALAVALAWTVAALLLRNGQPPVFAAIAALLVVQPSVNQSLAKGIERSVGVVAGVVIATALGVAFGSAAWVALVAVALALLAAWMLRLTPGATAQVGISALLVLTIGSVTPEYALDRIWETLLGVVVGFLVNLALVPPVAVRPAADAVNGLVAEVAASLDRLADALLEDPTAARRTEVLLSARLMRPMESRATERITAARESLTLNPRARSHRDELSALEATLDLVRPIVTQTLGMTRTFHDLATAGLAAEPAVAAIAEQLHRAAHDVRLLDAAQTPSEADGAADAALTRPLTVQTPSRTHWVLVGSLMVDLQRIHAALAEPGS